MGCVLLLERPFFCSRQVIEDSAVICSRRSATCHECGRVQSRFVGAGSLMTYRCTGAISHAAISSSALLKMDITFCVRLKHTSQRSPKYIFSRSSIVFVELAIRQVR